MLDYRVLLLDIEGTTTSISFVVDVLFPYARRALASFLEAHPDDPGVLADLDLLRAQARLDAGEGAPQLPAAGDGASLRAAAVANALWQMDRDRKTTGLKSLQGRIWREGYLRGELRAHVFPDVPGALRAVTASGRRCCIYSSGSVEAQQLLFAHSEAGELTTHLSAYFDTTTGPKREAASYRAIAAALDLPPSAILFVTDVVAEGLAAAEAGMQVRLSVRPGNAPQGEHPFVEITSLDAIVPDA